MQYLSLVTIAFVLLSGTLKAHNAVISGRVINTVNSEPVAFATLQLEPSGFVITSDAFGNFRFSGLQEGGFQLLVSRVGFEAQTLAVRADEIHPVLTFIRMRPTDIILKEVAVTSLKKPEENRITALDFDLRPVKTSQDLLRNVPGLFIAQHAGGGKAEQLFLRGFDIDHGTDVSISVDGMPVNMVSHAHGQGYADLHWVIPETVESFSFGKGPYYAGIGDFGTAGFVGFKTIDNPAESMVKVEAGSFNSYRAVSLLKIPLKNPDLQSGYLAGEFQHSDGPFEQPQGFRRYNVFGKVNRWLNPLNRIQLSASWFQSSWSASGQVPLRAVQQGLISRFGSLDPTEGGRTSRMNANVQLQSSLPNGSYWKNQLFLSNYSFDLFSNFTFFLEDTINGDQIRQKENRTIAGYNSVVTHETHLGSAALTVQAGGGIRYDMIDDNRLQRAVSRQPLNSFISRGDIKQLNTFAWVKNDLTVSKEFVISGALRYDNIQYQYMDHLDKGTTSTAAVQRISPKLNIYYQPSPLFRIFLNTGTGFHSNDARAAVASGGDNVMPGAYGADLGTSLFLGDRAIVTFALWTLHLDQEFVYVGDAGIVEASGATVRHGLDVAVRWQLLPWLYFDQDINYSYARSKVGETGAGQAYIPLAPSITSIGGLTVRTKKKWSGAF
ncbi:MAG: TonB-dependent receptor, partial [Sphingobacteriales bacterium]